MRYIITHSFRSLPNMSWEAYKDAKGWWGATIYSGSTLLEHYGLFPTPAMVLHRMRKAGFQPVEGDIPMDWQTPSRFDLTTKDISELFGLRGNQVTSACKNGSLKAVGDGNGRFLISEEDAADWHQRRSAKKTNIKPPRGQLCPRCSAQMVKDGVGKAPSICRQCGHPRRV